MIRISALVICLMYAIGVHVDGRREVRAGPRSRRRVRSADRACRAILTAGVCTIRPFATTTRRCGPRRGSRVRSASDRRSHPTR